MPWIALSFHPWILNLLIFTKQILFSSWNCISRTFTSFPKSPFLCSNNWHLTFSHWQGSAISPGDKLANSITNIQFMSSYSRFNVNITGFYNGAPYTKLEPKLLSMGNLIKFQYSKKPRSKKHDDFQFVLTKIC